MSCHIAGSSRLFVVRGKPEEVFPKLFSQWKVTKLTYEYDTEPYSLSRDKAVTTLAEESGVEVVYKVSHTLYDTERYHSYTHIWPKILDFHTVVEPSFILRRIIEENNGKTPLTYNSMQAIVKKLGPPKRPISAPSMDDMKGTKKKPTGRHDGSKMASSGFVSSLSSWQLIQKDY